MLKVRINSDSNIVDIQKGFLRVNWTRLPVKESHFFLTMGRAAGLNWELD